MKIKSLLQNVIPEFPETLPGGDIEVLREVPVETIYFALKKADDETALWVYSNARVEQIQGLMDLDCWNGDEFLADRFNNHFAILSATTPQRVWELSKWIDPEIIVRGLLAQVEVLDFNPQEPPEVMEQDLIFSPDNRYVMIMKTRNPDFSEALFQWMNKISAVDLDLMRRHLESCKWEQAGDLEEYGYQIKKGRLEDLGFVERIEAIGLYSKGYSATELKKHLLANPLPAGAKNDSAPLDTQINTDLLPEKVQDPLFSGGFLSDAIAALSSDLLKRTVYQELVRTINAMIVADELLHEELEIIGSATKRARLYLDLGLTYLADGTAARGAEMLQAHRLFDIYRLGWLLVQNLVKVAGELSKAFVPQWFGQVDASLLTALNGRHPKLPSSAIQDLGIEEEDFIMLDGITKVGERLAQLQLLGVYYSTDLYGSLALHKDPLTGQESVASRLMTGIFRQASGIEFSVAPLTAEEWLSAARVFEPRKLTQMSGLIVTRAPEAARGLLEKRLSEESELLGELIKHHKEVAPSAKFVSCVRMAL